MTVNEYVDSLDFLKDCNTSQATILDIMHHETKVQNHCFMGEDNQKLIIRDRSFFVDQLAFKDHEDFLNHLELRSKVDNETYDKMLEKSLSVIKSSANNRIINGRRSTINFNGINAITDFTGLKKVNKKSIQLLIGYLEDVFDIFEPTHLIVGAEGYKTLRKLITYSNEKVPTIQESIVGKPMDKIILRKQAISIIWAGKQNDVHANDEVIGTKDSFTDLYLVDFSPNGLTFALEIFPIMKKNEGTGITYFLETAQWLCQNSENCCYKISQRV